jgi:hypothetical protein
LFHKLNVIFINYKRTEGERSSRESLDDDVVTVV